MRLSPASNLNVYFIRGNISTLDTEDIEPCEDRFNVDAMSMPADKWGSTFTVL